MKGSLFFWGGMLTENSLPTPTAAISDEFGPWNRASQRWQLGPNTACDNPNIDIQPLMNLRVQCIYSGKQTDPTKMKTLPHQKWSVFFCWVYLCWFPEPADPPESYGVKALIFLGWNHGSNKVKPKSFLVKTHQSKQISHWMTPLMFQQQKNVNSDPSAKRGAQNFGNCQTKKPSQLGFFEAEFWGRKLPTMSPPILQPFWITKKCLQETQTPKVTEKCTTTFLNKMPLSWTLTVLCPMFLVSSSLKMRIEIMKDEGWLKYVSSLQKLFSKSPQKVAAFFVDH